MGNIIKNNKGFTLMELMVVMAILAVLTSIVAGAVTGTVGTARTTSKDGDLKEVDTAVGRYEADNGTFAVLTTGNPTGTANPLNDTNADGIIRVRVSTTAADPVKMVGMTNIDRTCGGATLTMKQALAECFGGIDFTVKLVPNYLKNLPKHYADKVTIGTGSLAVTGADITITGVDVNNDTLELWLDEQIQTTDDLYVWNVDKNNKVLVLKSDALYGK